MRPDRLARLHAAVDRQAGEPILIVPFASGGYVAGAPDPDRPVLEIIARVSEVPEISRATGNGSNSGHNAEIRAASHTIVFSTSAVPFALERGDRIVLLERACGELAVNSVGPFSTDRMLARLDRLARGGL